MECTEKILKVKFNIPFGKMNIPTIFSSKSNEELIMNVSNILNITYKDKKCRVILNRS